MLLKLLFSLNLSQNQKHSRLSLGATFEVLFNNCVSAFIEQNDTFIGSGHTKVCPARRLAAGLYIEQSFFSDLNCLPITSLLENLASSLLRCHLWLEFAGSAYYILLDYHNETPRKDLSKAEKLVGCFCSWRSVARLAGSLEYSLVLYFRCNSFLLSNLLAHFRLWCLLWMVSWY